MLFSTAGLPYYRIEEFCATPFRPRRKFAALEPWYSKPNICALQHSNANLAQPSQKPEQNFDAPSPPSQRLGELDLAVSASLPNSSAKLARWPLCSLHSSATVSRACAPRYSIIAPHQSLAASRGSSVTFNCPNFIRATFFSKSHLLLSYQAECARYSDSKAKKTRQVFSPKLPSVQPIPLLSDRRNSADAGPFHERI